MEEDGDFAVAAEAEVAPLMCSATILPRELIVILDVVRVVGVEELVGDVALSLLVVVEGE